MSKNIFATRIVSSSNIVNVNNLLKPDFLQVDISSNGTIFLKDKDYIIFDFGKEISGGLRILNTGMSEDGEIRIRFGESLSEASSEICDDSGATNDHSPRDIRTKMPCLSDLVFGQTGFRFVRVDFSGEYWGVQHILASTDIDDREEVGIFNCDDQLVNDIWNTASYTLRLNLHNGVIWDGVKRDRLCWIGDAYNEIKALECLYKEQDEIQNILEFSVSSIFDIIKGEKTFLPSTYTLWWLYILIEKYKHDGDDKYFVSQKNIINEILDYVLININDKKVLYYPTNFIDWQSHSLGTNSEEDLIKQNDEVSGVNYFTILVLKELKYVSSKIELSDIVNKVNNIIKNIDISTLSIKKYKQNAAFAILAGFNSSDYIDVIKKGNAHGFSTFSSYIILKSLASFNEHDLALSCLKDYYGKMLELGATTFFEDFDIDWSKNANRIDEPLQEGKVDFHLTYGQFCYKKLRHSLAHGWSAGVIPYIVEEIIGLKQVNENEFLLEPHLSSIKNISYIYPHKLGNITINISKIDGVYNISLKHPKDVTIKNNEGEIL